MKWTIMGSGGCAVIPKPLCQCRICREARDRGIPYSRSGPSVFLHDINLLLDTPAEIAVQINRSAINTIDYLVFTHLDPDHIEGLRVIEQIVLDYRSWTAYPDKVIHLLLPEKLVKPLKSINSQYGSIIDFFINSGFITLSTFATTLRIGSIDICSIPVKRSGQPSFIYVFKQGNCKVVYAPCDIKPFPEHRTEIKEPDLLIIQPGIFEDNLKHDFHYPPEHVSRTTLYTFSQTIDLARRIKAAKTLFIQLEEYWHRSYDDYLALEARYQNVLFAYDGIEITI